MNSHPLSVTKPMLNEAPNCLSVLTVTVQSY